MPVIKGEWMLRRYCDVIIAVYLIIFVKHSALSEFQLKNEHLEEPLWVWIRLFLNQGFWYKWFMKEVLPGEICKGMGYRKQDREGEEAQQGCLCGDVPAPA